MPLTALIFAAFSALAATCCTVVDGGNGLDEQEGAGGGNQICRPLGDDVRGGASGPLMPGADQGCTPGVDVSFDNPAVCGTLGHRHLCTAYTDTDGTEKTYWQYIDCGGPVCHPAEDEPETEDVCAGIPDVVDQETLPGECGNTWIVGSACSEDVVGADGATVCGRAELYHWCRTSSGAPGVQHCHDGAWGSCNASAESPCPASGDDGGGDSGGGDGEVCPGGCLQDGACQPLQGYPECCASDRARWVDRVRAADGSCAYDVGTCDIVQPDAC